MVQVKAANGTAFCIDRTEVTEGQYAEFLAKTKASPGSEHADCTTNQSYSPSVKPPGPPWEPVKCDTSYWTPETTPNRPVVCIDWCDAFAYCAWAGKRLCGKIGGGRGEANGDPSALPNDALDPNQSQWFSACSQAGKTKYPYGDSYVAGRCAGADVSKADAGTGWAPRKDVGSYPQCRGSSAPWNGVIDMSGSVAEFTDECVTIQTPNGPQPSCVVRSGSYRHTGESLTCAYYGTATTASENYGFRCCKDLP
jgi:formylglycine-generating enzyme required for sulfatase activity